MRRRTVLGTAALALGLATVLAGPAQAAGPAVIHVPSDFHHSLSDTRATGHYEVAGSGLRVWTEGSTSTDKVAEYVDTNTPLADVGEPKLNLTNTSGSIPPGFQLVVDFDGNGSADGILVGEPTFYGNDWWASNGSAPFVKAGAPSHTGGSGSENHGTLDAWRANFPDANVLAFGFSLGSGVQGDWTIDSIDFAGTPYTFADDVVLSGKDQCKNGGWATAYPTFKNQGDCVSSFASKGKNKN
ncbi:hypothetical protein [Petropleomorpha daqingensis]|uniref:Uncharacterized protein n=1 Tax=Petropleomorpha daqingensis TaxID=2026353 RepID=A0A853CNK5_9ACTN|nr:hypothetical protein [Petropleomorpha daqingensis]NYJ08092.1 hypothetical protein [Petropleomorpha daqingensis]